MPLVVKESSLYRLDDRPNASVRRPSLPEIANQLARLDGSTFDQLYIDGDLDDGRPFFVCVDDGTGGNVVLNVTRGDQTTYLAGDEPADGEPEWAMVTSGGQRTDTYTRWVVSIDRAGRGLWYFLATGQLDPGLRWEQLVAQDFEPPLDGERLRLPRRR